MTLLLDSNGADAAALKEVFPEEFVPKVRVSTGAAKAVSGWRNASPDLEDSIRFLVERRLVVLMPDGRVVATAVQECDAKSSLAAREDDFGIEHAVEWAFAGGLPLEHCDPFAFECPRFDE
ncbi:MAG: hypothetical protein SGI72_18465 [Planctomycetota bacterium]|nr:hypothetical protein [Planctomycetota bacterium]